MKEGTSVHAQVTKLGFTNDVYVGNSLLNLYAATGNMALCGKLFDEMLLRDVVSWTVVISGFNEAGRFDDALIALERMRSEGVMRNQVTAVNALAACAGYGALDIGVGIHEHVKRSGWELDIEEGLRIFKEMSEKNVFTWNAIIKGLALSKNGKEAVRWFFRMEEEGFQPDEYGFSPSVKHYGCLVDLLARSKSLDEALRLITYMPFQPTVSSRAQANSELSETAAWKLVELEPQNPAYYVVLSNLYAEMGRWIDVEKVRKLMKGRGLKKDIGSRAVELENQECCLELVLAFSIFFTFRFDVDSVTGFHILRGML
ncbi:UNVERIFIED_CONTAM: Pentatricopeptide repeat-containing protein [Sesamum indicum]